MLSEPRTKLVAAASRAAANRDTFANEFPGVRMYTDYREMLTQQKPDLVSICGFPQDREPMLAAALAAGAKVLWVEKPFALSLGEGSRMRDQARAANGSLGFAELHVSVPAGANSIFRMVTSAQAGLENPATDEHFHHSSTDPQIFYTRAIAHLLDTLEDQRPSMFDVEEAMKGLEITVGAFESARLRKPLNFPIEQQAFPLQLEW